MSGQPNVNSSDKGKFREQYLASLELRAKLDNVNLQANRVYKRTGQLPSEPSDFRSLEEKLADSERLRHEARASLTDIADGREANKISIEMTPDQLLFYSQQKDTINAIIKQQFKLGVYADTFLPFLTRYMNDTAANYGISTGLQQASGANVVLNGENLIRQITNMEQLEELVRLILRDGRITTEDHQFVAMMGAIQGLIRILDFGGMNPYEEIKTFRNEADRTDMYEMLNDILQEIPTKVQISRKMDILRRFLNAGDMGQVKTEMERIQQLCEVSPDAIQQHTILMNAFTENTREKADAPRQPYTDEPTGGTDQQGNPRPAEKVGEAKTQADLDSIRPTKGGREEWVKSLSKKLSAATEAAGAAAGGGSSAPLFKYTSGTQGAALGKNIDNYILNNWELLKKIDEADPRDEDYMRDILEELIHGGAATKAAPPPMAEAEKVWTDTGSVGSEDTVESTGYGFKGLKSQNAKNRVVFKGRGLGVKPPRKYHSPNATDWSKGVNQTKRFVPIGRYIINKHRLDDDVVAMKRPAGSCIKDFPSTRVSSKLGKVIRHIVGGGIPEFDALEDLDDNEKAYLHNLAKETHIIDRLSIPAPKKSESDKEIDKFNVMRGEIMSGNDNKELVKKFKLLTMKLMNRNQLPKGQARDILFDLTSMGF